MLIDVCKKEKMGKQEKEKEWKAEMKVRGMMCMEVWDKGREMKYMEKGG